MTLQTASSLSNITTGSTTQLHNATSTAFSTNESSSNATTTAHHNITTSATGIPSASPSHDASVSAPANSTTKPTDKDADKEKTSIYEHTTTDKVLVAMVGVLGVILLGLLIVLAIGRRREQLDSREDANVVSYTPQKTLANASDKDAVAGEHCSSSAKISLESSSPFDTSNEAMRRRLLAAVPPDGYEFTHEKAKDGTGSLDDIPSIRNQQFDMPLQ